MNEQTKTQALPSGTAAAASYKIHVLRDIDDVAPERWDALLGPDDIQMSHAFVRTCQRSRIEEAEYWHVLIETGSHPVLIASLCAINVKLDLLASGLVCSLIRGARRVRNSILAPRVVICGLPVSFGQACLKIASNADGATLLNELRLIAESISEDVGATMVCFKEFDEPSTLKLRGLESAGFALAPSLPSWSLALPWRTYSQYVAAMRSHYRRQLIATERAAARARLKVSKLDPFGPANDVMFALYEQIMARAPFQMERLNRSFFDQLDQNLAGFVRALLVERHGQPIATAIVLRSGHVSTFLLAGIDYQRQADTLAYPFLLSRVVEDAIRSGAARLEMGQTSGALKSRFGAQAVPRFLFLRHRRRVSNSILRASISTLFPHHDVSDRHVFRAE